MNARTTIIGGIAVTLIASAAWVHHGHGLPWHHANHNADFIQGVAGASDAEVERWPPVATFSVLGYDPETGEVGGAVQSRVFSVGNGVLWSPHRRSST